MQSIEIMNNFQQKIIDKNERMKNYFTLDFRLNFFAKMGILKPSVLCMAKC